MAGYGGGRNWKTRGPAYEEALYRQAPNHHQSYYTTNNNYHHHGYYTTAQRYQNHNQAHIGNNHSQQQQHPQHHQQQQQQQLHTTINNIAGNGPATSSAAAALPNLSNHNTSHIKRVVARLNDVAASLGLKGQIQVFGSHISGLCTTSSDCDVTYLPSSDESKEWGDPDREKILLRRFADAMAKNGFREVVTVLKASLPLVKAIDIEHDLEVDLCVGNHLAYRNSLLMAAYCRADPRVSEVGKLVKQWTKALELVGSSDGHLNSYTFSLLVVHFLICIEPPVLPNLQELDEREFPVPDRRKGSDGTGWDSKFWADTHLLPRSANQEPTGALLTKFFEFYAHEFNWDLSAVSIRLVRPGCGGRSDPSGRGAVPRSGYMSMPWREVQWFLQTTPADQWIIEDPFELTRNLAAQCTPEGRKRMLSLMSEAAYHLRSLSPYNIPTEWERYCGKAPNDNFFMKCRVHPDKISSSKLSKTLQATSATSSFELRFPSRSREVSDAFIIFTKEDDRRAVYRLNESFAGEWQLRLMYCSKWALEDALRAGDYTSSTIEPSGPSPEEVAAAAERAEGGDAAAAAATAPGGGGGAGEGGTAGATTTTTATATASAASARATATVTATGRKPTTAATTTTTAAAWIEAPKGGSTSTSVVVETDSLEAANTQRLTLLLRKQEEGGKGDEEPLVVGSPSASDDGRDDAEKVRHALRNADTVEQFEAAIERAQALGLNHEAEMGKKKLQQRKTQSVESGLLGLGAASRARAVKLEGSGAAAITVVAASSGGAATAAISTGVAPAAADTGSTY